MTTIAIIEVQTSQKNGFMKLSQPELISGLLITKESLVALKGVR